MAAVRPAVQLVSDPLASLRREVPPNPLPGAQRKIRYNMVQVVQIHGLRGWHHWFVEEFLGHPTLFMFFFVEQDGKGMSPTSEDHAIRIPKQGGEIQFHDVSRESRSGGLELKRTKRGPPKSRGNRPMSMNPL